MPHADPAVARHVPHVGPGEELRQLLELTVHRRLMTGDPQQGSRSIPMAAAASAIRSS